MFLLDVASFSAIPIAAGIAVLRYRLYEIDLLINRTLIYGMLTALLALVHFGGVAAMQTIFRALNRPRRATSTGYRDLYPPYSSAVQPLEAAHPVVHR